MHVYIHIRTWTCFQAAPCKCFSHTKLGSSPENLPLTLCHVQFLKPQELASIQHFPEKASSVTQNKPFWWPTIKLSIRKLSSPSIPSTAFPRTIDRPNRPTQRLLPYAQRSQLHSLVQCQTFISSSFPWQERKPEHALGMAVLAPKLINFFFFLLSQESDFSTTCCLHETSTN